DFGAPTGVAHAVAVSDSDGAAAVHRCGYAGDVSPGSSWAFEHRVRRTSDGRRRGVAHGDGLNTPVAIAAGVGGRPGARNNFTAPAVVGHAVAVGDGHGAAGVLGAGDARVVGAGVSRTIQHDIGGADQGGLDSIPDRNGLHATGVVAAGIGGGPGAPNDLGAPASVAYRIAVTDAD